MTRSQMRNYFAAAFFCLCAASLMMYKIRDPKRPKITSVRMRVGKNPDDRIEISHPTRRAAKVKCEKKL